MNRRSFLGLGLAIPAIPRILAEVGTKSPLEFVGHRRCMSYEELLKEALERIAVDRENMLLFGFSNPWPR